MHRALNTCTQKAEMRADGRRAAARTAGRLTAVVLVILTIAGCTGGGELSRETGDWGPAVSPDGKWVAFVRSGVHVARLGSVSSRLTNPGKNVDTHPSWSPDGSRIVFSRREGDGEAAQVGLYVVNRDGSGLRRLTRRDDADPSWSPDGSTIAYTRWGGLLGLEQHVRVMAADGTHSRVLVRSAANPAWSPGGSKIAFVQNSEFRLAVVDVRTRRVRVVTPPRLFPDSPSWSPEGRRIVFEDFSDVHADKAKVPGVPEIYVVNADGTGLRRLTRNEETDQSPTWTRGGRIVFASDFASAGAGPLLLYVMNEDGTGLSRLATGPGDEGG